MYLNIETSSHLLVVVTSRRTIRCKAGTNIIHALCSAQIFCFFLPPWFVDKNKVWNILACIVQLPISSNILANNPTYAFKISHSVTGPSSKQNPMAYKTGSCYALDIDNITLKLSLVWIASPDEDVIADFNLQTAKIICQFLHQD